jgi:putative DNA primase/helicase
MMTPLSQRANGRWRAILPALGIDRKFLTGRHCSCPMCGGRDRWRFDDKRGDGTWFCTRCGAGHGLTLAMKFTGLDFKATAEKIEAVIGTATPEPARPEPSEAAKRAALNRLWNSSTPIRPGDPVDLWLHHRGVGAASYPTCLRFCARCRHRGPPVSFHPAMIAKVADIAGNPATIHRTYLTTAGTKATVEEPRMFCAGKVPPGSAVRLATPARIMGIAEGIETALAAAKLFEVPTWAALSDNGVEKFEPPPTLERLMIFGDNDANGAGQRAAYALASRLAPKMKIEVRIPESTGDDWNDVLLRVAAGG